MLSRIPGTSKAGFVSVVVVFILAGCGGAGSGSSSSNGVPIAGSTGPQAQVGTATGSVSLSWDAPIARANGEQISYQDEIAGYVVRYGQNRETLESVVNVSCSTVNCEQIISELGEGTWYFAVRTRDANGFVSKLSEVVEKTI